MGPKAIQFISAVARKLLSKRGKGIASIPNRMEAEAKAGEIAAIFQQSGLPLNKMDDFLKSEDDVVKYLNIIEESKKKPLVKFDNDDLSTMSPDSVEGRRISDLLLRKKKSAAVIDLQGRKLNPEKPILGGMQETDDQIIARIKNQNKEAVERLKNKKDEPEGFYQGGQAEIKPDLSGIGHGSDALMARNMLIAPGSQATTSTGLNYLLGEDNDTTRVPYKEGETVLPKPKPNMALAELEQVYETYKKAMPGVSKDTQVYLQQDFIKKLNDAGISQEEFMSNKAEGERTPFAMGKRAFLKLLGGAGAGIAGIKTGLMGLGKKTAVKTAAPVVAKAAGPTVPPYFFKLVDKIKSLGDDVTETYATADRQTVKKYKDYEMTTDNATGKIEIEKKGKHTEIEDFVNENATEDVYMSYTPTQKIPLNPNKPEAGVYKTVDEYEEGTSIISNNRGNTGDVLDEIAGVPEDVIAEAMEETIKIGKAEGGRIGYAGGSKVVKGLAALIKKKFGKKAITAADELKTPQKTLDREMFRKFETKYPEDIQTLREGKTKSIIPKDEYAELKDDFNKEIRGMSDADNLMEKYPGMGRQLAEQIASDPDPQRKAHVLSMVEQTMEMGKRGMSGDEIIEIFKKGTDRTKHASGGLARMLGE